VILSRPDESAREEALKSSSEHSNKKILGGER
jgi:hypothetical protein